MAWNDANELVVAGTGQVYVAPVGTALPTTIAATLNAAFVGTGYTTEDGVGFSVGSDVTDFRAWQSRQAVRRERNTQDISVAFDLEQWNETNVPLAFGGGTVTSPSTGVYRYEFAEAGDALDEKAMIVDVQDGDRKMRIIIPRGTVTEASETRFQRTELAVLPITFSVLEPTDGSSICAMLFDDEVAFAAGS